MTKLRTLWNEMDDNKKRIVKPLIGAVLGAVLGYTYYATVGCSTGSCPITSNPVISMFWGATIGGMVSA